MPLLPPPIADLVAQDGQPRQATADDGTEHMLFLDGRFVRSCTLADWPAEQLILAQHAQEATDAAALRQAIRDRLVSLAGKRVDDLLVGDLKTLLLYLVWRENGIDKDMKVRPVGEWGK